MQNNLWRLPAVVLLMLGVSLIACRFRDKPTPQPKIESAVENPDDFNLPVDSIARRNAAILAERPDFVGRIVYVREDGLWKLTSDVAEPELLAKGIDPDTVYQSPDKQDILFATSDYRERAVYRVDWRSSQHSKILSLDSATWRPIDWSPDGMWVVILMGFQDLMLVKMDGTVQYPIGTGASDVFWLSDGNVLVVDYNTGFTPNSSEIPRFTATGIVDIETGIRTPLDIDLDQLSRDWGVMIRTLNQQERTIVEVPWRLFASTHFTALPATTVAERSGTSPYCQPWQISPVVSQAISLYEVDGIFRITDLRDLNDGSILYLEWTMPSCTITTPNVSLVHLTFERDGTATTEVLIDNVFSGVGIGQINNTNQRDSALYSMLPDGQTMLWVGGEYSDYVTTLNLLDLESGENHELINDAFGALRQTSLPFITAVYWVAS
jgi:hypothetical protein